MAGPGLFLAASALLLVADGPAPRPSCWFTLERDTQPAPATETWVVTRHCRGAAAPAAAALGPAVLAYRVTVMALRTRRRSPG